MLSIIDTSYMVLYAIEACACAELVTRFYTILDCSLCWAFGLGGSFADRRVKAPNFITKNQTYPPKQIPYQEHIFNKLNFYKTL